MPAAQSPIRSHVPGRLRLRSADLRRRSRNAAVCQTMSGWDGVVSAEGNPTTGSILLHYDPGRIDRADMEARIADLLPEPAPAPRAAEPAGIDFDETLWVMNRYAKWGMLATMAGSLAALAFGKKLHAALGALHLVFLAVHLVNYREQLVD